MEFTKGEEYTSKVSGYTYIYLGKDASSRYCFETPDGTIVQFDEEEIGGLFTGDEPVDETDVERLLHWANVDKALNPPTNGAQGLQGMRIKSEVSVERKLEILLNAVKFLLRK